MDRFTRYEVFRDDFLVDSAKTHSHGQTNHDTSVQNAFE